MADTNSIKPIDPNFDSCPSCGKLCPPDEFQAQLTNREGNPLCKKCANKILEELKENELLIKKIKDVTDGC